MPTSDEHGAPSDTGGQAVQAAQYIRMSTEHQQYSTQNQKDVIADYARRGLQIVRTYADEGKSRLRIESRDALRRLISDVESGEAPFQVAGFVPERDYTYVEVNRSLREAQPELVADVIFSSGTVTTCIQREYFSREANKWIFSVEPSA